MLGVALVRGPVDLRGLGAVQVLRPARDREVAPRPVDKGLNAIPDAGHENRVDSQPGGECEQAVYLPAPRAHRRDRRVAPDHRHDALVLVLERLRRVSGEIGEQVVGCPRAALQRHGAELGQRLAVGAGDVRDVADHVEVREALHRQVVLHVDPAAASLRHAGRRRQLRRLYPACPHHAPRLDLRAVPELHVPGRDFGDLGVEVQLTPRAREDALGILVRLGRERAEQVVAQVHQVDSRRFDLEMVVLGGHRPRDHVRQRARGLDARRAAAHDDEVERPALDQRGVTVGGLEHAEDPGAQPGRVLEEYSGKAYSSAPGVPKKFGSRPRRQHDRVRRPGPAVLVGDDAGLAGRSTAHPSSSRRRSGGCETACAARTRSRRRPAGTSRPGRAVAGTGGSCCGRAA